MIRSDIGMHGIIVSALSSNSQHSCSGLQVREANQMVEEMMLLANVTVAEHVLSHFGHLHAAAEASGPPAAPV